MRVAPHCGCSLRLFLNLRWSEDVKVDPIVVSYGLGHASFEITKRIYAQTVPLLSSEFSDLLGEVLSPEVTLPRVNDGGGVNVQ